MSSLSFLLIKNKKKKKNIFGIISTALIFLIVLFGLKSFIFKTVNLKKLHQFRKIVSVGKSSFRVMTAVNAKEWQQGLMGIKKLNKKKVCFLYFQKR